MGTSFPKFSTKRGTLVDFNADKGEVVTPSDTKIVSYRSLYVGGEGTLVVELSEGGVLTYENISGFAPLSVKRVLFSGTTATNINGHL